MTHQWPQNQLLIDDHPKSMMDSSSSSSANNKLMEKTNLLDPHQHQHQQQQQQTPPPPPPSLKCPRCDSSNTKFCYYNNYSLSQPRHFCKACKRYWTRGGTLRNVPVGGGCRKNKKLRRPSSGSSGAGISAAAATANPSSVVRQQQIDLSSSQTSNYINNNPSFYPLELNFPFSGYSNSTRVSSDNNNTGFDLQQQPQTMMNDLGLGFSAGFRQIQDNVMTSSSSPFSSTGNYNSVLFGSSSAFASNTSTMASLLASTLQQQKFGISDASSTDPASNYEDNTHQNRSSLAWNQNNPIYEQIISNSSDPASSSSLVWNTTNNNAGSWFDPSNMGSSVPSLI